MLHRLSDVLGYSIRAEDGQIGSVQDAHFDEDSWDVRYVVVETGTWLPGRLVLLSPESVAKLDHEERELHVRLLKADVENGPSLHAHEPLTRERELELRTHYGWPIYWPQGASEARAQMAITAGAAEANLHSAGKVAGYSVQARDGQIGHIEDFLFDDESWNIRHLIVDTRIWWPGKKVVVLPQWLEEIDWALSTVHLNVLRETIQNCPEYDPAEPIDPAYEARLEEQFRRLSSSANS